MKRLCVSVISAACLALIASMAYAGAAVYHDNWNDNYCSDYGNTRYCYSNQGVWHQVITPSGNNIYKYSGTRTTEYSFIDTGEVFRSDTRSDKRTRLFKSGEGTHVYRISDYDEYCRNGYERTYTRVYQFVNGQVVINERDIEYTTC